MWIYQSTLEKQQQQSYSQKLGIHSYVPTSNLQRKTRTKMHSILLLFFLFLFLFFFFLTVSRTTDTARGRQNESHDRYSIPRFHNRYSLSAHVTIEITSVEIWGKDVYSTLLVCKTDCGVIPWFLSSFFFFFNHNSKSRVLSALWLFLTTTLSLVLATPLVLSVFVLISNLPAFIDY